MPGGFHPFHAGHYALYQSALKAFPGADVYVAATNDQSERPFPFEIKEKLAKVAGVAPKRFVQVKSPFQPKEITQNYDPNSDVLIFVRSEKDKTEQPKPGGTKKDGSPSYFQPWTGKNLQPFSKHAYIAYLPTVTFGPGIQSATEIRNAWPKLDDRRKTAMVMSLYPATQKNPKLAEVVVKLLDAGMGGQINELKCWTGYTRVQGVPAGAPGSCKKKTNEEQHSESCPHCGGEMVSEELMNEKKDACYYKVKSRYKVWPSAYASGALVKCRKKGASNWGTGGKKLKEFAPGGGDDREPDEEEILRQLAKMWWLGTEQEMAKAQKTLEVMGWEIGQDESGDDDAGVFLVRSGDEHGDTYIAFNHSELEELNENLNKWFKEKWVRFGPDGKIRGDCARGDDSEGKPKCLPQSKAQNLGKKGRASAAARKRREDPNPERSGKAINVNTKKKSNEGVAEGASLSVEQLAHISDKALDNAYHYGRSTPGANFGWMANMQSAKAAKRLIDAGETDIEVISDAIHKGWNVTAAADYKGQLQLDTPTPEDKKLKRAKLAMQSYSQLPEEEKEKDRVVARALLQAINGKETNIAESADYIDEK